MKAMWTILVRVTCTGERLARHSIELEQYPVLAESQLLTSIPDYTDVRDL